MRILFIYSGVAKYNESKNRPSFVDRLSSVLTDFSENLVFPTLAAVTPEKHSIELIDARYQKINFYEDYDLVGITVTTPTAPSAYLIADEFRRRGVKVVLGGCHPSAMALEAKEHADSVVIGDAEETWPQLLIDFENHDLKPFYEQKTPSDLSKTIAARREILGMDGLDKILLDARLEVTRGCSNRCKFCAITNICYGGVFRTRPIDKLLDEIRNIPQKMIRFASPSMTVDLGYTKQLFKEMKGLGKRFVCDGNIDVLGRDDELLKLANEAGCISWFVGFDSITQKSLDSVDKKSNKAKDYVKSVKKVHDYGMMIDGSFIFGFDQDMPDVFDSTINFIDDLEIDRLIFYILTPYPGTPLFTQFDNEGRILTKDWSRYTNEEVVFRPKNMPPEELYEGTQMVKKYYASLTNSIKRSLTSINLYGFLPSMKDFARASILFMRYSK